MYEKAEATSFAATSNTFLDIIHALTIEVKYKHYHMEAKLDLGTGLPGGPVATTPSSQCRV